MVTLPEEARALAPGEGCVLEVLGEHITIKLRGDEAGGRLAIIDELTPPLGGVPLHMHRNEDEAFYIVEGQYEMRLGDQLLTAEAGAFIFAPRGIPHSFYNPTELPARLVIVISPAGLENMFAELALLRQPVDLLKAAAIAQRYDLEFLGSA